MNNKTLTQAYTVLFTAVLIGLGVAAFFAMIRSITAKTMINRFIGINILSTVVLITVCILAVFLKESYLPDVALVYALLSCIAVMLLCRIYINLFEKKQGGKK